MAHTLGPWRVVERNNEVIVIDTYDPTEPIATIGPCGHPVIDAHARLIAAAPEIYKLLSSIVSEDPILDDADSGPYCKFCFVSWSYYKQSGHKPDCEHEKACALLTRIDNPD